MLRVVDISSHQGGIDVSGLDCDCIIVKATGGVEYVNPFWRQWADEVLASGKKLGFYHYAAEYGNMNDAWDEARHFLDTVSDYKGKAILALDFEAEAQNHPVSWARQWLETVAHESGGNPWFYGYAGYLNSRDHSEIRESPLWMASYLDRYIGCGWVDDPDNIWPTGSWERMTAYQYASQGRIWGYDGNLDLSVYYGSHDDWKRQAGDWKEHRMIHLSDVWADIHRRMCDDPRFGYSWEERYGFAEETWNINGKDYRIKVGDYECGTSVKTAVATALQGTPYEGCLDGYVNSRNCREVFVNSGLFEWHPMGDGYIAQKGDIYLNEANHVAMCQSAVPDMLSEFCWGEKGAYGNQRGDQTGEEAYVHAYYDYPDGGWDGILAYNGKADYETEVPKAWDLITWHSNGGDNQRFEFEPHGKRFAIRCKADGRYLDVEGEKDEDGAKVILYSEFHGRENQLWELEDSGEGDGCFFIVSAMAGHRVLDIVGANPQEGGSLCIWPKKDADSANQKWMRLTNYDGTYAIMNNGFMTKLVLDSKGGGR